MPAPTALNTLRRFGEELIPGLLQCLEDADAEVRMLAIELLDAAGSRSEPTLAGLISKLGDPDRLVRMGGGPFPLYIRIEGIRRSRAAGKLARWPKGVVIGSAWPYSHHGGGGHVRRCAQSHLFTEAAMKPRPHGNGSGKFGIGHHDMGGCVRVCAGGAELPDDLPVYLSQALTDFFRKHPHLHLRCVVPIQKDGDTVELHAWYDAHLFPATQGPRPEE